MANSGEIWDLTPTSLTGEQGLPVYTHKDNSMTTVSCPSAVGNCFSFVISYFLFCCFFVILSVIIILFYFPHFVSLSSRPRTGLATACSVFSVFCLWKWLGPDRLIWWTQLLFHLWKGSAAIRIYDRYAFLSNSFLGSFLLVRASIGFIKQLPRYVNQWGRQRNNRNIRKGKK